MKKIKFLSSNNSIFYIYNGKFFLNLSKKDNFNFFCFFKDKILMLSYFDYYKNFYLLQNNYLYFISLNYYLNYVQYLKILNYSSKNGFYNQIFLNGLGYKVWKINNYLIFDLNYSHYTICLIPKDLIVKVRKYGLLIFSYNNNLLNYYSNFLIKQRLPDSYKGKGIINLAFKKKKLKVGKQR